MNITTHMTANELAAFYLGVAVAEMRDFRRQARKHPKDRRFWLQLAIVMAKHARHMRDRIRASHHIPADPQDREDALDNHPAVKAITGEKAA